MGDACVLDFLTNTCGLPLMTAVALVPSFVAASVTTRETLFALTDAELKTKCGVSNAAQRKKVMAAVRRGESGPVDAKRSKTSDAQVRLTSPTELPLHDIDQSAIISVNRSPVMILWSAVVAHEVLSYSWEEALSLAHVVSALNAQAKAARIWNRATSADEASFSVDGPRIEGIALLGREVPACRTPNGVRGVLEGKAVDPRAASNRIKQAFSGPLLAHVYSAVVCLARHEADALRMDSRRAYSLYEAFRPSIPDGAVGWGAAGALSIARILAPLAGVAVGGVLASTSGVEMPIASSAGQTPSQKDTPAVGDEDRGPGGSRAGLRSRILEKVGEAGVRGLSPALLRNLIGEDCSTTVEQLQMESLVYSKDGHLFLL